MPRPGDRDLLWGKGCLVSLQALVGAGVPAEWPSLSQVSGLVGLAGQGYGLRLTHGEQ